MPLMLSEIIDDPTLGLELIAGKAGLASRGPIQWIHSSGLPAPTRWLKGGEVLLITGFGVRGSPLLQRRLMVNLDKLGCIGLGLGLGDWLKAVPEVMIKEANRRHFPLFTVPYSTPFSVVTKRVAERIFEEQYSRTYSPIDPSRQMLAHVLAGSDVTTLVASLAQRIPRSAAVLFNFYGEPLIAQPSTVGAASLWRSIVNQRHRDRFLLRVGDHFLMGAAVGGETREGVIVVVSPHALTERELIVFEQALIGIRLALRHGLSPRQERRAQFGELLADILDGALKADALPRKLAKWGFDASKGFQVSALSAGAGVDANRVLAIIEDDITTQGGIPLAALLRGRIYILVMGSNGSVEMIRQMIRRNRLSDVAVGVSRTRREAAEIPTSIQEADLAVEHPSAEAVRSVDDLGFSGLLPHIRTDRVIAGVISQILDPVRAYDAQHGSELMRTLKTFGRCAFRPGATAKILRIHRHTLAYRLNQVARLTGRDVRNGDHLVELGFALVLADGLDTP
jgi:PucR family transcriptional regulator, purine catabolism regulatory protein